MSISDLYTFAPLFRIRGDIITSVNDAYGEVTVIDNKHFRIMSFDRVFEQSKMQISAPWLPVHNYISAMLMSVALTPASQVMVLGLGGGCLVRALHARNTEIAINVVELRAAVLCVAQVYFHLPMSNSIHYQVGDAAQAVANDDGSRYHLILSDLYSANAIAPLQSSAVFLRHCAAKLRDDGWLVLNHSEQPENISQFSQTLLELFATVLYCIAPSGNVVVYASPSRIAATLPELQQRMKECGSDFDTDFAPLAQKLAYWPGSQR
ncbi:spermidine synthase [Erwinia sorbitola]|uniref:Spermidine synthase n=1 Tax=Erwinia sorbitola TaxID=2681984 RepID=A0A6I6EDA3_9GAMM|nr:spermidine synthase [Erwinia sorbitola]MTD25667.1 spermidine synthase [Erwinia sorbitola]QGU87774.1 spermidine synthase [Erwinia sorbitola]